LDFVYARQTSGRIWNRLISPAPPRTRSASEASGPVAPLSNIAKESRTGLPHNHPAKARNRHAVVRDRIIPGREDA
jgi:hypothetical protein